METILEKSLGLNALLNRWAHATKYDNPKNWLELSDFIHGAAIMYPIRIGDQLNEELIQGYSELALLGDICRIRWHSAVEVENDRAA